MDSSKVKAIGISGQQHGLVPLDAEGKVGQLLSHQTLCKTPVASGIGYLVDEELTTSLTGAKNVPAICLVCKDSLRCAALSMFA